MEKWSLSVTSACSSWYKNQEGSAVDILIIDGNKGPSGASSAHLLCPCARDTWNNASFAAERKLFVPNSNGISVSKLFFIQPEYHL